MNGFMLPIGIVTDLCGGAGCCSNAGWGWEVGSSCSVCSGRWDDICGML